MYSYNLHSPQRQHASKKFQCYKKAFKQKSAKIVLEKQICIVWVLESYPTEVFFALRFIPGTLCCLFNKTIRLFLSLQLMKNTNCDCVQTFDKTKLSTWSILGLKNQYFSVTTV
jgi:hypothetical protein